MKTNKRFCDREFRSLLISGTLVNAIMYVMNLCDTMIAGQFVGEAGIAAVNTVTPVTGIIMFLGTFISNGVGVIYTRAIGAMKKDRADKIYGQGMILSISIGLIAAVVVFLMKDVYFETVSLSGDILKYAGQYYSFAPINAFLTIVLYYLEEMIYCDGDTLCTNICYVLQICGNVVLSIILTKSMGMSGIMLGTVIGNVLGIIVCSWHFFRKSNSLHFVWYLSVKDFLQSSRYSIIDSITVLNWAFMIYIITGFISVYYGDTELTVFAIVVCLIEFSVVLDGVGTAIQPLIGTYYAEENHLLIKRVMRSGMKAAIIEGVAATVIVFAFTRQFCGLFGVTGGEALIPSIGAIRIVALGFCFCSIILLLTSYYNYIDRIGMSVFITCLLNGVLFTILPITGSLLFGSYGLWIGFAIAPVIALAVMILYIYFRHGKENLLFFLKNMHSIIRVIDEVLTPENSAKISERIGNIVASEDYPGAIVYRASLFAEEIGNTIYERNKDKNKTVYIEYSVLFETDSVMIIERDSGELFDITDPDLKISGLSSFVFSGLMSSHKEKAYQVTTGYNRNMIRFRKNNDQTMG